MLSLFGVCKTKQSLSKRYGFGRSRGTAEPGQPGQPEEQPGLTEEQTASYQGAFEAVLAVPIAAGVGYWCDGRFDSAPTGLLVGVGIGFCAMLLRIVRMRPSETDEPTERATENSAAADRPETAAAKGGAPEGKRPASDRESDR